PVNNVYVDWTPVATDAGAAVQITLTATDRYGASRTSTVTVNVASSRPNASPSLTISAPFDTQQDGRNTPIGFTGQAIDPDGSIAKIEIRNLLGTLLHSVTAQQANVDPQTGQFGFVWPNGIATTTNLRIQAIDNQGAGSTKVSRKLFAVDTPGEVEI